MNDDFWFDVGLNERHRVEVKFNRLSQNLKIMVDGPVVRSDQLWFDLRLTNRYEFIVGYAEQHAVVVEKRRSLLFRYLIPSTYKVLIDGQHVRTF
jgi:hypothetical protein